MAAMALCDHGVGQAFFIGFKARLFGLPVMKGL
jgi:hypothetical protein